jgi:hypothetical protein
VVRTGSRARKIGRVISRRSSDVCGQVEQSSIRVELTLELVQGSDPPRGRLSSTGGSHPFAGWLGLALALERAIEDAGVGVVADGSQA